MCTHSQLTTLTLSLSSLHRKTLPWLSPIPTYCGPGLLQVGLASGFILNHSPQVGPKCCTAITSHFPRHSPRWTCQTSSPLLNSLVLPHSHTQLITLTSISFRIKSIRREFLMLPPPHLPTFLYLCLHPLSPLLNFKSLFKAGPFTKVLGPMPSQQFKGIASAILALLSHSIYIFLFTGLSPMDI